MTLTSKARRRWFGALCLVTAIALLVAGETILKGRLSDLGFVAYWFVCFAVTMLAIMAAILDLRAVREETHAEQRALFENTLQKVQEEKASKSPNGTTSKRQSR